MINTMYDLGQFLEEEKIHIEKHWNNQKIVNVLFMSYLLNKCKSMLTFLSLINYMRKHHLVY